MANFNPGLNPTADPEYDRVRGVDLVNVEGHNKEIQSRRAAEGLFTGLGAAVRGTDKALAEGAQTELQQGYEKLNGAQGVDVAAGAAVINPDRTVFNPLADNKPPTQEQSLIAEGMERLNAARDQGKISNTHYYAQLEAMVRNVKSRYPGYGEIIDRQIEGIAGIKPANALRQSMLHDMERAAAASAEKMDTKQKFILNNAEYASEAEREKHRKGEMSDDQMIASIQDRKGKLQEIQAHTTQLAAKSAENKLSEDEAKKGASQVAYKVHALALDNVSAMVDQAQAEIRAGTYDPVLYGNTLHQVRMDFRKNALATIQKGVGTALDVNQVNQIIQDADKAFDDYSQAFTKDGTGMLSALKTEIEAMKNKDYLTVMRDGKVGVPLRAISAANAAGGPEVAKALTDKLLTIDNLGIGIEGALNPPTSGPVPGGQSAAKRDPVAKALVGNQSIYMGLGDRANGDPKKLMENLVKVGKDQPTNVQMVLASWKDNLTNPKYGADFLKNSAEALFSDGNKDFLTYAFKDYESRREAFKTLTSPQVTEAMQKLKGSKVYDDYKKWAYDGYVTVLKGSINKLQNVAERPYLDLKMDEESGHLSLVPNAEGQKIPKEKWYNKGIPYNIATGLEMLLGRGLSENVRELNNATDNVKKIMETDGYKVGDQFKQLVGALAQSQPEKKGIWNWIARSIQLPKGNPDDLEFGGIHPNFTQASGTNGEPRGLTSLINSYGPQTASRAIMEMIAKGESGSNYNRLVDTSTHPKEAPLTDMTIREVLSYQKGMLTAGNASSAAGKYQIVSKTLKGLVDKGVVAMNDKYDQDTQDKLANALLEGRGYKDYLEGGKTLRDFMKDLGEEWEIIKVNPSLARKVADELASQKQAYASAD